MAVVRPARPVRRSRVRLLRWYKDTGTLGGLVPHPGLIEGQMDKATETEKLHSDEDQEGKSDLMDLDLSLGMARKFANCSSRINFLRDISKPDSNIDSKNGVHSLSLSMGSCIIIRMVWLNVLKPSRLGCSPIIPMLCSALLQEESPTRNKTADAKQPR